MQLTDNDRQEINRLLSALVDFGCIVADHFTDATAADRAKQWLVKNGFRYETSGSPIKGVDYYASIRKGGTSDYIAGIHSVVSEHEALALACVEEGKFCPECRADMASQANLMQSACPHCGENIHYSQLLNWRVRPELERQR